MKVKKFKIQAEVITCDQDGWLDNESLQEAMGYIAANWESTGMGSCFIPCNTLKSQELKVSEKDVDLEMLSIMEENPDTPEIEVDLTHLTITKKNIDSA